MLFWSAYCGQDVLAVNANELQHMLASGYAVICKVSIWRAQVQHLMCFHSQRLDNVDAQVMGGDEGDLPDGAPES